MNIRDYKKIMIIGNNGSGKSYLSEQISAITQIPVFHLDLEYWQPNWQPLSEEDWTKKQNELVSKEQWIIDGNYTETLDIRFKQADLIIFLNLNRFICLSSVLRRRKKKRIDFPNYLDYKFDKEFISFCKRLLDFPKSRKKVILALHDEYPQKEFLTLNKRYVVNKTIKHWKEEIDNYETGIKKHPTV